MKKITYVYVGLVVILTCCFYSCQENVLETIPTDRYNEGNWWQNEDQAIATLNGCYAVLRDNLIGGAGRLTEDNLTPNTWGMGGDEPLSSGSHNAGNTGRSIGEWNANYEGIGRVNYLLDNIDKVDMESTLKQRIKGEAYFLRALFYFNLVKYFGGVPLILEAPNLEEQGDLPRDTREQVINQVLTDLDNAASALPLSYSGSNIGRATKGAALALKARVLLFESEWSKSASAAKAVMDLNQYSLFPDYRGLFMLENENNEEVIFDVQYIVPEFNHRFDIRLELQQNVVPTLDLVNSYFMKDGLPIDESPLYDPEHPYENRDPRLHQTIIIPGYMYRGSIVKEGHYYGTGFGFKKYTTYKDDVQRPDINNSEINFIILRYADVLLMYAEAKNEVSGPDESVYNAINKIRSRAGMPDIPSGLTKEQMREVIRHERRIELVLEGRYYQDIRRWHTAEVVMNGVKKDINGEVVTTVSFNPARDYLLPIHVTTIQENPALEQNPGY